MSQRARSGRELECLLHSELSRSPFSSSALAPLSQTENTHRKSRSRSAQGDRQTLGIAVAGAASCNTKSRSDRPSHTCKPVTVVHVLSSCPRLRSDRRAILVRINTGSTRKRLQSDRDEDAFEQGCCKAQLARCADSVRSLTDAEVTIGRQEPCSRCAVMQLQLHDATEPLDEVTNQSASRRRSMGRCGSGLPIVTSERVDDSVFSRIIRTRIEPTRHLRKRCLVARIAFNFGGAELRTWNSRAVTSDPAQRKPVHNCTQCV